MLGSILSVAAPIIGGMISNSQKQDFAEDNAASANQFTREQLQSRHQWEVADLRAAGLNPILSAMKGAPSIGGSAQAVASGSIADDVASLSNSASAANQQRLNNEKLEAEIDLLKSNSSKARAEARNTEYIGDVSKNLGNISQGFHGLTENTSDKISRDLRDWQRLPELIQKAFDKNKSEGHYSKSRFLSKDYWLFKD